MKPTAKATATITNESVRLKRNKSWLKRIAYACLAVLVLLITAALTLPYTLPWALQKQGIDFHWQNPQWQLTGFTASHVQLNVPRADAQLQSVQLEELRIDWAWHAFPIQRLQAERLQAHWPIEADETPAKQSAQLVPAALLKWLPQHIQLQEIDAKLAGLGHLQGTLNVQASAQGKLWQPSYIHSALNLSQLQGPWLEYIPVEFRPTDLSAQITTHPAHQDTPDGQQLLTLDVHSLGPMRFQLNGLLDLQQEPSWHGALKNTQLFIQLDALAHPNLTAEQLQARLYLNGHADTETFALRLEQYSSLEAHNLQLADLAFAHKLSIDLAGLDITGHNTTPDQLTLHSPFNVLLEKLNADPLLEQDWRLTGNLSGQLPALHISSQLHSAQGVVINSTIELNDNAVQGNLSLPAVSFSDGNPLQKTFTDWPVDLAIHSGQLHSQVDFNKPLDGPWHALLKLNGNKLDATLASSQLKNVNLELSSQLDLHDANSWQLVINQGQFLAQLDAFNDPSLRAQQLHARTFFTGQLNSKNFVIHFNEDTLIESAGFQLPDLMQGQTFSARLAKLNLEGHTHAAQQMAITSPLHIQVKNLHSAQLHNQDWAFKGTLKGQPPSLTLNGDLNGEHGLSLETHLQISDDGIQGTANLQDVFFRATNPLQKTLKDWPELVSFDSGRLRSQLDISLPKTGPLQLNLLGSASGLNGIINRSELSAMALDFNAQLNGQRFNLNIPQLTIEKLDPGVPLTALQLDKLAYRASLSNPLTGIADWQSIQVQLLNGRAWLDAQQLDLSRPQKVLLHVQGIELQELFRVYPTEGLAGHGIIDGQLPLHIEPDALYIKAGQLQAREPGVLKFQSEKIQALGRSNPAMQVVADALDDFHFNLLSSGLSYDQSGKLILNVRLEGQNPDVEKGRPIHLNISLEEDIPALLASIQLSGQVSEIIQKRVRERLEKR